MPTAKLGDGSSIPTLMMAVRCGTAVAATHRTVKFDPSCSTKMDKDEKAPTLQVARASTVNAIDEINHRAGPETIRIAEACAMKKAYELSALINPRRTRDGAVWSYDAAYLSGTFFVTDLVVEAKQMHINKNRTLSTTGQLPDGQIKSALKGSLYNRAVNITARGVHAAENTLTVGTDCSGMDSPIHALQNLGISFKHLFSCDNDPHAMKTISANHQPEKIYKDVKNRDNSKVPSSDLYIAGFPCQSFSAAGKQEGFEDKQGKGNVFFSILDYIKTQKPKVFILENVKGLVTLDKGKCLRTILKALRSIPHQTTKQAYEIHHQVLNTKDHGIPQHRPRWYCVGIRKDTFKGTTSSFAFPQGIACPSIEDVLQTDVGASEEPWEDQIKLNNTVASNLQKARKEIIFQAETQTQSHGLWTVTLPYRRPSISMTYPHA